MIGVTSSYSSIQSLVSGASISSTSTVSSFESSGEHVADAELPLIFVQDLQEQRERKISGLEEQLHKQKLEVARAKAKLHRLRSGLSIVQKTAPPAPAPAPALAPRAAHPKSSLAT